eukprot:14058086-Heterocapsa_arctica.AAC.1
MSGKSKEECPGIEKEKESSGAVLVPVLLMVRVLADFRRRYINPATRKEERLRARTSSGRH